jgi:hypothetical protein
VVVGYADCGPDGADLHGPGTHDLEVPHLLRVHEGQCLAHVAVAVLLHQLADEADRLPRGGRPFEHDLLQVLDEEEPLIVAQLAAPANGRLADGESLLVHGRVRHVEEAVRLLHVRDGPLPGDAAQVGRRLVVQPPPEDGLFGTGPVRAARLDLQPRPVVAVAAVGGHDGTVGRRALAHHDAGAAAVGGFRGCIQAAGPLGHDAGRQLCLEPGGAAEETMMSMSAGASAAPYVLRVTGSLLLRIAVCRGMLRVTR